MASTVAAIHAEAKRLTAIRAKNAKGFKTGKRFSGPRQRKLKIRA